ncbi:hypothetical protein OBBRIDRAFT_740102 [Obba rivulosa]|uniref:Uncharacterized protein n=1 Tax=Obba rivulosa TaxID=1052685 RepID=A0A8E2AN63_9APHY|nr:hypothetical protein OBBRIDRAFT_740102 [Obba rivulosa]
MLSLPSTQAGPVGTEPNSQGLWGYFTPRRTKELIARESQVAVREAEVARREAELLAGAPGGVIPSPIICPACPTEAPPVQTVIKEVVKEESLTPPGWWDQARVRAEDILDRELKIAEREREIGRREEAVNRREHDASRREGWIMEQLVALNMEEQPQTVEEEYLFEPAGARRKPKALPPPLILTETAVEFATKTITHTQHHTVESPPQTVTVPPPARVTAGTPLPDVVSSHSTAHIPRTTAVEVVVEEFEPEEPEETVTYVHKPRTRPPRGWWGGW